MIGADRFRIQIDGTATFVDSPFNIEWQNVLNGVGSASFMIPRKIINDAGADVANPSAVYMTPERVLRFEFLDANNDTVIVGLYVIKDVTLRPAAEDEGAGEVLVVGCQSMECVLRHASVYPATGMRDVNTPIYVGRISTKPYSSDRYIGPMEPGYDRTDWVAATQQGAATGTLAPSGWNDPSALWIGGNEDLIHFAAEFTTEGVFSVSVLHAFGEADSVNGEIWLDGVLLDRLESAVDEGVSSKTRKTIVEVTDGTHLIYGYVERLGVEQALLLATVYEKGTNNVLLRSDTSWLTKSGALGTTPGAAMSRLRYEAQDRSTLEDLGATFSEATDTFGNKWTDIVGQMAFRVAGDSYLDVVDQMSEGYVDWAVLPTGDPDTSYINYALSMWVAAGELDGDGEESAGRSFGDSGVSISRGVNATQIDRRRSSAALVNTGLIMFRDGILEASDNTSVVSWGRREVGLSLGGNDGPSALNVAAATILPISNPEASIVVGFAPRDDDETPYLAFGVGDWVTVVDDTAGTLVRCVAITAKVTPDGYIEFTVEFGTLRDTLAQRHRRWLSRTDGGTVEGKSRSATPTSPSIIETRIQEPFFDTISSSGGYRAADGDDSPEKPMADPHRLVRLEAKANEAGTGATTLRITKNGVDTSASVVLPADTTENDVWLSPGVDWGVADYYGMRVVGTAGGHVGIAVKGTWVPIGG